MTLIDLSRSHLVKENSPKWNFLYDFLSVNNSNYYPILHHFRDIGQNSSIVGAKKQIGPSSRHPHLNRKWPDIHMAPPETFSLHQVWTKSRWYCPSYRAPNVFTSKMAARPPLWMISKIYLTCIILGPNLVLASSFKIVDPYTFEKSLSKEVRTYIHTTYTCTDVRAKVKL